jgi:hypothetical protein
MSFSRREATLELTESRLRGLWLSLNAPVVSVPEIPLRPARAAIAVHEEADGRPNVTVGICSLEGSARVLFTYGGDLRETSSAAVAVDAALAFAEGMGFLFDDDELAEPGPAARAQALRQWKELMGESEWTVAPASALHAGEAPAAVGSSAGDPREAETSELELMELELTEPLDVAPREVRTRPPSPPAGAAAAAPPLTKFRQGLARRAPGPAPPERQAEGRPAVAAGVDSRKAGVVAGLRRAALGRLKLVRRRGGAPDRPGWILRLLSSF